MEDMISYGQEVKLPQGVMEKVEDGAEQPLDYLPDGWIMEFKHDNDGVIYKV